MKRVFFEFIKFVQTPYLNKQLHHKTFGDKIKALVSLLLFCILYTGLVFSLLLFFYQQNILDPNDIKALWEYEKSSSVVIIFVVIVFLIPFLEELIFRLSIIQERIFLKESLILLALFIILKIIAYKNTIFTIQIFIITFLWVICLLFVIYTLLLYIFQKNSIIRFYQTHPKFIVYFSVFIFGLSHVLSKGNFISISITLILLLISTIYIFGAFALSFMRINLGFFWGVWLHTFYNLSFVIFRFLLE